MLLYLFYLVDLACCCAYKCIREGELRDVIGASKSNLYHTPKSINLLLLNWMTRCLQMYAAGWGPLWAGTSSCYYLPPSPLVFQNWSILCKLICMRFRGHGGLFIRNCNKVAIYNKQTNKAFSSIRQIPMRITIKYLELAKRSKVIRFIQFLAWLTRATSSPGLFP